MRFACKASWAPLNYLLWYRSLWEVLRWHLFVHYTVTSWHGNCENCAIGVVSEIGGAALFLRLHGSPQAGFESYFTTWWSMWQFPYSVEQCVWCRIDWNWTSLQAVCRFLGKKFYPSLGLKSANSYWATAKVFPGPGIWKANFGTNPVMYHFTWSFI